MDALKDKLNEEISTGNLQIFKFLPARLSHQATADLNSTDARSLAEMANPGKSGIVRRFNKSDTKFMLKYGLSVDTMQDIRSIRNGEDESVSEYLYNSVPLAELSKLFEMNGGVKKHTKDEFIDYYKNDEKPETVEIGKFVTDEDIDVAKRPSRQGDDPLGEQIAQLVLKQIDLSKVLNKDTINKAIHEKVLSEIETVRKVKIEAVTPNGTHDVGVQHEKFETLLKVVANRINVMMVGPAGSGKTHAGSSVAKALGLSFHSISVGQQTSKVDFLGYMDAHGNYVSTHFRKAYENGGVFLIDEIDAGNPNVITIINAATANHQCAFPDKMVDKHDDFIVIAAANTFGRGADRKYVGRNQLDAATLDRFVVIEWDYDRKLEREIGVDEKWLEFVQDVRKAVEKLNIRHVVSPRASINGSKMLAAGIPRNEVEDMVIWKGLDKASVETIKNNL
jgi:cobaltochelatase CobS